MLANVLSSEEGAQLQTIVLHGSIGAYAIMFDERRMPRSNIQNLVLLSPYVSGDMDAKLPEGLEAVGSTVGKKVDKALVVRSLENCPPLDPRFEKCAENFLGSPSYIRNAELNISQGEQGLNWLENLPHPTVLNPVIDYIKLRLRASLWMQRTRLEYYKSGKVKTLENKFQSLDLARECAPIIGKIKAAPSMAEAFEITKIDWNNCANREIIEHFGRAYPISAWREFLKMYGLKEVLRDNLPD
jgi:hypothetical protein